MNRIPLLDLPSQSLKTRDPQVFAQTVSGMLRLKACDPLITPSSWWSTTSLVQLGEVTVLATSGTPVQAEADAVPLSTFMLPWNCSVDYQIEGKRYLNPYRGNVLHIPPLGWSLNSCSEVLEGYSLLIPPSLLCETARTINGGVALAASVRSRLSSVSLLSTDDAHGSAALDYIFNFFGFLESVVTAPGSPVEMLRLDDLLVRQILLLMCPGLGEEDSLRATSDDQWFDDLLDWIDANCGRSLSLTDLEARGGYSRRSLQYLFRKRFDCTPMEWVRRRRLQMARRILQQGAPGLTVRDVSLQCGYINFSAFSRDYRQQFGCTASADLRRTARVEHQLAD